MIYLKSTQKTQLVYKILLNLLKKCSPGKIPKFDVSTSAESENVNYFSTLKTNHGFMLDMATID